MRFKQTKIFHAVESAEGRASVTLRRICVHNPAQDQTPDRNGVLDQIPQQEPRFLIWSQYEIKTSETPIRLSQLHRACRHRKDGCMSAAHTDVFGSPSCGKKDVDCVHMYFALGIRDLMSLLLERRPLLLEVRC